MAENKTLIMAKFPVGYPIPGEDLIVKSSPIDINAPPPEGGLILKTHYLSYDPFQVTIIPSTLIISVTNPPTSAAE